MCDAGLADDYASIVRRVKPVQKSSHASRGGRPDPEDHYESVEVTTANLISPDIITLVDDVITRGSTLMGVHERVRAAYPNATIHCFALVRTISGDDIDTILDPVEGTISYGHDGVLRRRP